MHTARRKTALAMLTLGMLLMPATDHALLQDPRPIPARPAGLPPAGDETAPSDMLQRVLDFRAEERAAQRQRFLEAEQALAGNQRARFRELLSGLRDYPLHPYLLYADLARRLPRASREELDAFLAEHADLPPADSLRQRILERAAQRKDWDTYLHFYRPTRNVALQCHALRARLERGETETVYPDIRRLWLSGESRPRPCDPVFDRWREAGRLTDTLLWQRIELALDAGQRRLAGYLARQLPAEEGRWARLWIGLHRYPEQLERRHQALLKPHPRARDIFLDTLHRLARRAPLRAVAFWERHGEAFSAHHRLDEAERAALFRRFALSLALRHHAEAKAWFARVPEAHQTDTSRAWRVRLAIRESRWADVLDGIAAMPEGQRNADRWRYWQARALGELGQTDRSQALLDALADRRNYYGFLAADRLGRPYPIRPRPYQPSAAELFEVQERPDIRRAAELYRLGRLTEARREWRRAVTRLDETGRLRAAKLAQLWGWTPQSILTMASTSHRDDLNLRFPLPYREEILSLSASQGLQAAWTYGVIRRESAFVSDARSPRGATGLMQLMPDTARRISRDLRLRYRGRSTLLSPESNLRLGTGELARMLRRFDNQTVVATAAYNAGPRRVSQWLPEDEAMEADRWIETIPYRETREYVSNVLAYTIIYANRLGQPGMRLHAHMGPVQRP